MRGFLHVMSLVALLITAASPLVASEYPATTPHYATMLRAISTALREPQTYIVAQVSLRDPVGPQDHKPNGRPLLKDSNEYIALRRDADTPPVRLARVERVLSGTYDEPIVLYYDKPVSMGDPLDPEVAQYFGISEETQQSYLVVLRRIDPESKHTVALTWPDPAVTPLPLFEVAGHGYAVWDIEAIDGPGAVMPVMNWGHGEMHQRRHTRPRVTTNAVDDIAKLAQTLAAIANDEAAEQSQELAAMRMSHQLSQSIHWELVRALTDQNKSNDDSAPTPLNVFDGGM